MEKRIELEKRGRNPDKVFELNLDNCRGTSIVGLTDEFINLHSLSLINVGLTSLKGFPKLPNLRKLELSDNRISAGLNLLNTSPKLTHLNISGNKIKDLDTLEPLKEFKNLKYLDLFTNEATTIDNYRAKVFNMIPSLKCLDGFDREEREVEDSEGDDDELNGNESENDFELMGNSDEEDEDEEDDDDLDDEDVGLDAVYKEHLDEESEGEEFDADGVEDEEDEDELGEEEEEDGDDEEDGEEDSTPRGKKRKLEDGEDKPGKLEDQTDQ